jgi:hypothetical protein
MGEPNSKINSVEFIGSELSAKLQAVGRRGSNTSEISNYTYDSGNTDNSCSSSLCDGEQNTLLMSDQMNKFSKFHERDLIQKESINVSDCSENSGISLRSSLTVNLINLSVQNSISKNTDLLSIENESKKARLQALQILKGESTKTATTNMNMNMNTDTNTNTLTEGSLKDEKEDVDCFDFFLDLDDISGVSLSDIQSQSQGQAQRALSISISNNNSNYSNSNVEANANVSTNTIAFANKNNTNTVGVGVGFYNVNIARDRGESFDTVQTAPSTGTRSRTGTIGNDFDERTDSGLMFDCEM